MRPTTADKPNYTIEYQESAKPVDFRSVELPADELRKNLPDSPGAHTVAIFGIKEDFEAKELTTPVLVKISFNPKKVPNYTELLNGYEGIELNDCIGERNRVELRLLFDSDRKATGFIKAIRDLDNDSNFGMSVDNGGRIMTAHGKVFIAGDSLVSSDSYHNIPNNHFIPTFDRGDISISYYRPNTHRPFTYQKLTNPVYEHALGIEPTEPEMPHKNTVEITIRGANNRILREEEMLELIEKISQATDSFSHVINQSSNSVEIIVGEESAPGAVGQKMHQTLLELGRTYNVTLDVSSFTVQELNGRVLLSRTRDKRLPSVTKPGIHTSHDFRIALAKTRNRTLATYTLDENGKVTDIKPNYTEIPDETQPSILVARDEEVASLRESITHPGQLPVRVVTGVSGVGKTALMQKVMNEAKAAGVTVAYLKTPEHESRTPTFGIRLILKRLFELMPFQESNSVLHEFANNPAVKLTSDQVAIGLLKLLGEGSKKDAILLCIDDLHWADSFTDEVLATYLSLLPNSNGKIATWFASRIGEEGISEKIKTQVEKHLTADTIELEEFKNLDDVSACIQGSMPNGYKDCPIPESFVKEFQKITGGIPLDIKELVEYLIERKLISLDPKTIQIIIPQQTEDKLRNEGTAILDAVYENKFKRLSRSENEILDFMVIFSDLGQNEFISLMEKFGKKRDRINKTLEDLERKKMIGWEPFGFRHDRLHEIKKAQLDEKGKIAKLSAEGFSRLKGKNIPPITLFKLLTKASAPSQFALLDRELQEIINANFYPTGNQALASAKEDKNTILAGQILEDMLKLTEKPFLTQIEKAANSGDSQTARSLCVKLAGHYLDGINLSTKAGKLTSTNGGTSARNYDSKLSKLLETNPSVNTGKIALNKLTLEMKTALAASDQKAYTELASKVELELDTVVKAHFETMQSRDKVSNLSKAEQRELVELFKAIIEARAELLVIKAKPPMNEDAKPGLQEFQALKALPCNTNETLKMIDNHVFDIKRNIAVMETHKLITQSDPDFIYLEELTPEKIEKCQTLLQELSELIKYAETEAGLDIEADKIASLYNMAARLIYLTTKDINQAEKHINSGIKLTTNHHAILSLARLRKVRADAIKQINILSKFGTISDYFRFTDIKLTEFASEDFEKAISDHDQSIAELNRVNPDDILIVNNALNRAILAAMLYYKNSEEGEINNEDLVKEWALYVTALEKYKNRQGNDQEDYLNELTTAGWFLQVADLCDVKLRIPDFITLEDISTKFDSVSDDWYNMRTDRQMLGTPKAKYVKINRIAEVKTIMQRFGMDKLRQALVQKDKQRRTSEVSKVLHDELGQDRPDRKKD